MSHIDATLAHSARDAHDGHCITNHVVSSVKKEKKKGMSHIDATLAHSARDAYVLHGHCIHELCRFLYEKGKGKGIESHRRSFDFRQEMLMCSTAIVSRTMSFLL